MQQGWAGDIPVAWIEPERAERRTLVIWLPGFSGTKEKMEPYLADLAAAGFVALGYDPHQHGERMIETLDELRARIKGNIRRHFWPILARTAEDVTQVIDWAVDQLGVGERVGMGGISAGGERIGGGGGRHRHPRLAAARLLRAAGRARRGGPGGLPAAQPAHQPGRLPAHPGDQLPERGARPAGAPRRVGALRGCAAPGGLRRLPGADRGGPARRRRPRLRGRAVAGQPRLVPPAPMKFHVGVIGATGYIGTPYREEMRGAPDAARIVALCARRRDRLQAAAQVDGCSFITDDWRQVVGHPEVDLVVVTTPDRLHREPALAAAAAGKHLFCDKPVGADVGEAYEIWCAYRDSGLAHYVPYWTRYEPKFRRVKELLDAGTLGEPKVIVYRWHNPRPAGIPFTWRDDASLSTAGSVADVGSHAYDAVRWLIGSEARRVVTQAGVLSPPKPDLGPIDLTEALDWGAANPASAATRTRAGTAYDYGAIIWEFHNGAVGAMLLSHAPGAAQGVGAGTGTARQRGIGVDRPRPSHGQPGQRGRRDQRRGDPRGSGQPLGQLRAAGAGRAGRGRRLRSSGVVRWLAHAGVHRGGGRIGEARHLGGAGGSGRGGVTRNERSPHQPLHRAACR